MSLRVRIHGLLAVMFGTWEAAAFTTRRLPTVSSLYAKWRLRQRRRALVAMWVYLVSLGHHLATYRDEPLTAERRAERIRRACSFVSARVAIDFCREIRGRR